MHHCFRRILIIAAIFLFSGVSALQPVSLREWPVKFSEPLFLLPLPEGDFAVIEKGGPVYRTRRDGGKKLWFSVADRVCPQYYETGLLGMALDPDFRRNGFLYLYSFRCDPDRTVVSRILTREKFREQQLLKIPQPYRNHNGGMIAFGKDQYLYVGVGDGGAGGDPHGNGQNTATLLGSILRLDVSKGGTSYAIPASNPFVKGGGRPEIYAWGLRNPWRFSFDRQTGELFIGDVGQNKYEEVHRLSAPANLGWNRMEGLHCYRPSTGCRTPKLNLPIHEYDHEAGNSIVGGYVYRGRAIPALQGRYLFTDTYSGRLWSLEPASGKVSELMKTGLMASSLAEDSTGELFILDLRSGKVFELQP